MDGCIVGPPILSKEGDYVMDSKRLQGTFELKQCTVYKSKGEPKFMVNSARNDEKPEIATWLPKKDIIEVNKNSEEKNDKINSNEVNLAKEKNNCRCPSHKQHFCHCCAFIDHMLKADGPSLLHHTSRGFWHQKLGDLEDDDGKSSRITNVDVCSTNMKASSPSQLITDANVNNGPNLKKSVKCSKNSNYYSSKNYNNNKNLSQYIGKDRKDSLSVNNHPNLHCNSNSSSPPQQFTVQADVHRENVSFQDESFRPSAVSSPTNRRDEGRILNLALSGERYQIQQSVDNSCKARIPISLKDFKGEIKAEIEIFKNKQTQGEQNMNRNSSEPFLIVATEVKLNKV